MCTTYVNNFKKENYTIMNKIITLGISSLAIAGVVGLALNMNASAYRGDSTASYGQFGDHSGSGNNNGGGSQVSLESRASVVNMTAEELQTALETKTMSEIAVENGMSEDDFDTKMSEAANARWEARGIDAEEIANRTAERAARQASNSSDHEFGSGEGNQEGGYGHNRK